MMVQLHIGIDDTDSLRGGCTTHVAAEVLKRLAVVKVRFLDYPNLVRLNPNIPWKTRGNGAVCLRLEVEQDAVECVKEEILEYVINNSDTATPGTDPAVVFMAGRVPQVAEEFAKEAMWDVVPFKKAFKVLRLTRAEAVALKGPRGLIGALAAVGEQLRGDHTYEAIAYRAKENWGHPRRVDASSTMRMDEATAPYTWNNFDEETGRILVTPRGRDPILFGVRGETPEIVARAVNMIIPNEPVECCVIFRTNQGTDSHLTRATRVASLRAHRAAVVEGGVASPPMTLVGGHVFFQLRDQTGGVSCAAYEPTGSFRNIVRQLVPVDHVRIYGGVRKASRRHSRTLNIEKLELVEVKRVTRFMNPLCQSCGKRMTSMGRNQGYRCDNCGFKSTSTRRVEVEQPRSLTPGLYLPSPRAHRHLTKPLRRYGREKAGLNPASRFVAIEKIITLRSTAPLNA
ncbi:MAG: DUF1743 domain-containing protein [Candidatus Bathyarchaeia archaeon]